MVLSIGLVEDDRPTRERLVRMLSDVPHLRVAAACAGTSEAMSRLPGVNPHVVLVDMLFAHGDSGVQCVRQLQPLLPETQFMMLTVVDDPDQVFEAIVAGATGYLLKSTPPDQIIHAIRELHAGGSPMTASIARKLLVAFQQFTQPLRDSVASLTNREQEVLKALARGATYKQVANELGVSADTIRTHAHNIYRKLQAHSRREAVRKAAPFWKSMVHVG